MQIHRQLEQDGKPVTAEILKRRYYGEGESPKMLLEAFNDHNKKCRELLNKDYVLGTVLRYERTVRHHYREHPHVHIVFNRIDNNGKTITDKNDRYRNEQVCKQLKQKHGLYFAPGKMCVKQDCLKEPDKTKYEIYTAIKSGLKHSKDWQQLQGYLSKNGIQIRFKYKGKTNEVQGISFNKGEYSFKGSEIDRNFSYSKLDAQLNQNSQQQQEALIMKPDSSAPKATNTGLGIGGSLFGFSHSGSMPDDSEQIRLNELRKKKKKCRLGL